MTEFSKIEVPSAQVGSKDETNNEEGGIFEGNCKADFYHSLHDQLGNPKMKEALEQLGAHEKS